MANNSYNQNSIPIATSQNFIEPDYQQQSQFSMGTMQEEAFGQHVQNETQNMMMPSQNHRSKRGKKVHKD